MNTDEEKLQRFVIRLIDMTVLEEIYWHVLDKYDCLRKSSVAQLAGPVYYVEYGIKFPSLRYYQFILYRCRRPVEIEDSISFGWKGDFSYYLAINDLDDGKVIFRDEISKFVELKDLYEEVQNQIRPIDDLINQVLSK